MICDICWVVAGKHIASARISSMNTPGLRAWTSAPVSTASRPMMERMLSINEPSIMTTLRRFAWRRTGGLGRASDPHENVIAGDANFVALQTQTRIVIAGAGTQTEGVAMPWAGEHFADDLAFVDGPPCMRAAPLSPPHGSADCEDRDAAAGDDRRESAIVVQGTQRAC